MPKLTLFLICLILVGCGSTVIIDNTPHTHEAGTASYSIKDIYGGESDSHSSIVLAFSGGGTRAAALAYGVLLELAETRVDDNKSLLDDVSVISAVSGGSVTAAYFGLRGPAMFDDFEQQFLTRNIDKELRRELMSPARLVAGTSRTEGAIDVFKDALFGDATFADLRLRGGPMILINTTDLASGARLSFIQDYFDLLCSKIDDFPIAKAVTASASVPILFAPVVVENYTGCDPSPSLLATPFDRDNSQLQLAANNLHKLAHDKTTYQYLHLVDGGISDNLGLRSLYEVVELNGGIEGIIKLAGPKQLARSALILVDASVDDSYNIGRTAVEPSLEQTINAMSDIQLHRYNASTIELVEQQFQHWHQGLTYRGQPLHPLFITVALSNIDDDDARQAFYQIPTSFNLKKSQVDALIQAGRDLLRQHPQFQQLLNSYL